MINVIIVAIVIVAFAFAGRRAIQVFSGKRDCCGGGACDTGAKRRQRPADLSEKNYPYQADLSITGMHCENCANKVAGALESAGGAWADVDFRHGSAHVFAKQPLDQQAMRAAVRRAGYRVAG
ncbi:MAG: heavy-metal-associated domain-containing protein [Parafannyhessea sp.]|uniref:heavy-metal-associated domain-containing protein n=1 Tax=Parafannyhessea sp. TaxID=2847324 RepID=UPI003F010C32